MKGAGGIEFRVGLIFTPVTRNAQPVTVTNGQGPATSLLTPET